MDEGGDYGKKCCQMGLSNKKNLINLCRVGKRNWKNMNRVKTINEKKIQKIVKFAYDNSPFYHELYDQHNIDINQFKIEDLPIITKDDILSNYDRILTDKDLSRKTIEDYVTSKNSELLLGKYGVFSSGGSSGIRCHIPYDEKSMYMLNALTILRSGLIKPSIRQRIAFLGGVNHTNNTKNLERNGFFKNQFRIDTVPLFIKETEVLERLNVFQPTTIAAYSYMLRNLAVKQINGDLKIAPKRMRCGGTPLSENDRNIINKAFGILPFENYGASEALLIASECNEHKGLHINEDCYCIEFYNTRKHNDLVHAEGVLITNPNNTVFPLIKYRLDDRVVYTEEKCKCGCDFRRIVEIKGRESEHFVFDNQQVNPIEILNRVYGEVEVDECRLVQRELSHLEVRIVCSKKIEYNSVARQIYEVVRNYVGIETIQLRVSFYDELMKDRLSGKLVPFITINKWKALNYMLEMEEIFSYSE